MNRFTEPDKIMTARNEFRSGRAAWHHGLGIWVCKSADPCLGFLVHMSLREAHLELTRRGFEYEWEK